MAMIAGEVNNDERWVSPRKVQHLLMRVVSGTIVNEDNFGGLSQGIRNFSDPPVHFRENCSLVIAGNDKTDIRPKFSLGPQCVGYRRPVHCCFWGISARQL